LVQVLHQRAFQLVQFFLEPAGIKHEDEDGGQRLFPRQDVLGCMGLEFWGEVGFGDMLGILGRETVPRVAEWTYPDFPYEVNHPTRV
jgi:hypothetical protein